jgi:hypothetical protein
VENALIVNISDRINKKSNVAYVTATVRLTGEDMIKHATTIILEPAYRPGMDFITDMSEAEVDPSLEILLRFYNHFKAYK